MMKTKITELFPSVIRFYRAVWLGSLTVHWRRPFRRAGAAEAIAAILALRNDTVPPTVHLEVPDPVCDLDYTPNTAVRTSLSLALSNSLGFGGHNACLAFVKGEGCT